MKNQVKITAVPCRPVNLLFRKITDPKQIPDYTKACSDLDGLREAIARSLTYMGKPSSRKFYPTVKLLTSVH